MTMSVLIHGALALGDSIVLMLSRADIFAL